MACGAFLLDFKKQRVAVAIDVDAFHRLEVTGGFAFTPAFFTAAAIVYHFSGFQGFNERFPIHKGDHEDFVGIGVLGNRRDQSLFVEPNIVDYVRHDLTCPFPSTIHL